jgi:hypothetical protein
MTLGRLALGLAAAIPLGVVWTREADEGLLELAGEDLALPTLAVDADGARVLVAAANDGERDRVVSWRAEGDAWGRMKELELGGGALLGTRLEAGADGTLHVAVDVLGDLYWSRLRRGELTGEKQFLETVHPFGSGTDALWVGEMRWSASVGATDSYADPDYDVRLVRGDGAEPFALEHPGVDLQPQLVDAGGRVAVVWTNSYFPTRVNGDLEAVGYDRWADKVYCVAWIDDEGSPGAPLEIRLSANARGGTTISDRAFPVAGEEPGEVWILYGELVGSAAVGKSWRLMLCRVGPDGASAPVPLDPGRLGPFDQLGVVRVGGRVHVVRTVHELAGGRQPEHSALSTFSFSAAELPPREPLAEIAAEPRKPAVEGLDLSDDGRDERHVVEQGRRQFQAYFGNLHLHSDLSRDARGYEGSPAMNLQVARDVARLDFAMLTDHVEAFAFRDWWTLRAVSEAWNREDKFVTLAGYEWTSPKYGHKNVVFADARGGDEVLFSALDEDGERTPDELWAHLGRRQAITIPHHPSHGVKQPTDWSFRNDQLQRLVEIFQVRGNYEYDGAPFQKQETQAPFAEGHSVRDALAMGHRLGIIASPDHGGGFGLAGVWSTKLTREAIFEALHARRTFGTTGAKMSLFLRVNDAPQGGEITHLPPRPLLFEGFVSGTVDGLELTLVSDGEELWTRSFDGREGSFEWTDERPFEGKTRYVYLRATQSDGHIGWTSPVWINPPKE